LFLSKESFGDSTQSELKAGKTVFHASWFIFMSIFLFLVKVNSYNQVWCLDKTSLAGLLNWLDKNMFE